MSYDVYRFLHVVGIIMIFVSLGGMVLRAAVNDTSAALKKNLMTLHGLGLVIALVAGFGAIAKAGIAMDGWVMAKLVIWLVAGGAVAMIPKYGNKPNALFYALVALGALAAYFAIFQPF